MVMSATLPLDAVRHMRWLSGTLSQRFAGNSEPLHPGNEARPRYPELDSGSARSTDDPIGFMERRRDVRPLGVDECPDWCR
jgi:hypothetical protein